MRKKGVGIIGAGKIVEDRHLPILKNLKEVQVDWISDSNPARARWLSRMYGVAWIPSAQVPAALTKTQIGLITVPWGAREEYLNACAQANVAVYVEKPFARTRAEHERYSRLFPNHRIAVGLQRRLYKATQLLKRVTESRTFGRLKRIEFRLGRYSLLLGGSSYLADPRLSGGGVVIEAGIHGLDQILFIVSAQSVEVQDARAVVFDGIEYEAQILSRVKGNGSDDPIEVLCHLTRLRNLRQGFTCFFESAQIDFGIEPGTPIRLKRPRGEPESLEAQDQLPPEIPQAQNVNQAFWSFWRLFLEGVERQKENMTCAATSWLTTAWVEKIYQRILKDEDCPVGRE